MEEGETMKMQLEIEEEYNLFLNRIASQDFIFGIFMDEMDYEDEYSKNDICKSRIELQKKIKEYLHENRPGEFLVFSDFCIHVMTPEWARKWNMPKTKIELRLVK